MKKNRSYTYVFPCIASTLKIDKNLILNTYLKKEGEELNSKIIFIEVTKTKNIENLNSHPQIISYEEETNTLLIKFKLNLLQAKINSIYIKGKYSTFPNSHKEAVLNYHNLGKNSKHYQILYKLPVLRHKLEQELKVPIEKDAELGIKTNIIEEIYINNE